MTPRPIRWNHFLELAEVVAKRATCPRRQVGAIIVTADYHVISTGYNGAPKGAAHCSDRGCQVDEADHCIRAVHAEANAIVQAACNGNATRNSIMFCTHEPCRRCLGLAINAGIKSIVFEEAYKADAEAEELSRFCEITLTQWRRK